MAEFSTGAELELEISQRSLREARDTIESELGDLEVDISAVLDTRGASSGGNGDDGGGSGLQLELMRRQLNHQKRSADLDEETGNYLEELLDIADEISSQLEAGGGGASRMQPRDPSSGRFMGIEGVEQRVVNTNDTLDSLIQIENERWELDKYRNDYLEQLAEGGGMLQQGGQQGQGGGGSMLPTLGLTSILSGISATAVGGAAAGGSILAGAFGANEMFGRRGTGEVLGRSFMQSGGNPVSFATQTGSEIGRSIGLGEEAQQLIEGFGDDFDWPDLPPLSEQDWPEIPDLTQNFDWPDPPEFNLNPFDSGQPEGTPRSTSGLQRRGPNDANQPVEPTINLGGITVDVTTTIDNAVDDAVDEVEDTVDREIGNLEDRIADAIGGFF